MKPLRIYLSGASGLGKTTLAKAVARELNISYVNTSASNIWEDFGVTSHQDAIQKSKENPSWAYEYQKAILENRKQVLSQTPSFITDRSLIDNLVYFMDSNHTSEDYERYREQVQEMLNEDLQNYSVVFIRLIRPFSWQTEVNGKRISNEDYQIKSNLLFKGFDFRYFMAPGSIKSYYSQDRLVLTMGEINFIGHRLSPTQPMIYDATITTRDFKQRILTVLQILVNIGFLDESDFLNISERVTYKSYNFEDYR